MKFIWTNAKNQYDQKASKSFQPPKTYNNIIKHWLVIIMIEILIFNMLQCNVKLDQ